MTLLRPRRLPIPDEQRPVAGLRHQWIALGVAPADPHVAAALHTAAARLRGDPHHHDLTVSDPAALGRHGRVDAFGIVPDHNLPAHRDGTSHRPPGVLLHAG